MQTVKKPAVTAVSAAHKKSRFRKNLVAYSFIAPNFIGFAVFTLVPMVMAVALAFLRWDGSWANPIQFVGIQNFLDLFQDAKYL